MLRFGTCSCLPLFFILKAHINISGAAIIMIIVLLPFMLPAMYEKNGQPFEKVAKNIINVLFIRPKQRPYKTNNYYSLLEKQDKLNKEVERIVKKGK